MTADQDSSWVWRHPLTQLVVARFREFWRQPEAVFWVYGFPLLMMVALGVAFRHRPIEKPVVVVQSEDEHSAVFDVLQATDRFTVSLAPEIEAGRALRTGKVDLLLAGGESEGYEYRYDPTKPGGLLARNAVDDILQRAAGREDVVASVDQHVSKPGSRYIDFLIPGLIGMGLMGGGMWGVGFAIVDMRIRKLLKRFLATPMKRSHFLLSVMISRLIFTLPEVLFLILLARLLFGVKIQGSMFTITALVVLGAFEFAGIGLLVASRVKTLESVSGLMNLVMLPLWIASGIFFTADRFPEAIQPLLNVLPLKPLIDGIRATMLEGAGLWELAPNIVTIVIWGGLSFALALTWFRWE